MGIVEVTGFILSLGVAFGFGYLFMQAKALKRQNDVAFFAALHALTEAKSVKNATVLNRVIEVYKPVQQQKPYSQMTDQEKQVHDELEQALSPDGNSYKDDMLDADVRREIDRRQEMYGDDFNPKDFT